MKSIFRITFILILILAALKLGIHIGVYQFQLYDSPYKAFVASKQLEKLKSQEQALVKAIQNEKLTKEIINYGKFCDHGFSWILWPLTNNKTNELFEEAPSRKEFIQKAIKYRKNNPVEFNHDLSDKTYYDKAIQNTK
jgi:hypothetical protein